jgi:ligand-binding sensor domain-containing protein
MRWIYFWGLFLIGILGLQTAKAQDGYYYLSHYQHNFDYLDYHANALVQDENGIMFFAHRKGVMKFDGINWDLIKTGHLVNDCMQQSNDLYLAAKNDFGIIRKTTNGEELYKSLAAKYISWPMKFWSSTIRSTRR